MNRLYTSVMMLFSLSITQAYALDITHYFKNPNQQAMQHMTAAQYDAAEKSFTRADWQAVAAYRNKNYERAAKQFETLDSIFGFYNQGNALAQLGKYEAAIQAYDKALKQDPTHKDAKHNRALLKKLLEKNKQDNPNQQKEEEQKKRPDENQRQKNNPSQAEQKKEEQHDPGKKEQEKDQRNPKQDQSQQPKKPNKQSQAQNSQALRLIPDDPGGLLREKFWRDHWRRLQREAS